MSPTAEPTGWVKRFIPTRQRVFCEGEQSDDTYHKVAYLKNVSSEFKTENILKYLGLQLIFYIIRKARIDLIRFVYVFL